MPVGDVVPVTGGFSIGGLGLSVLGPSFAPLDTGFGFKQLEEQLYGGVIFSVGPEIVRNLQVPLEGGSLSPLDLEIIALTHEDFFRSTNRVKTLPEVQAAQEAAQQAQQQAQQARICPPGYA